MIENYLRICERCREIPYNTSFTTSICACGMGYLLVEEGIIRSLKIEMYSIRWDADSKVEIFELFYDNDKNKVRRKREPLMVFDDVKIPYTITKEKLKMLLAFS